MIKSWIVGQRLIRTSQIEYMGICYKDIVTVVKPGSVLTKDGRVVTGCSLGAYSTFPVLKRKDVCARNMPNE